jgi:hypothetical protein
MRTIAIAGSALVLAAAGASAATPRPALRIMSRAPVTVQGLHFKSREHVTVTVVTTSKDQKTVVASRTGAFRVTFDTAAVRCGTFRVTAVGSRGSVVLLKLPQPACAVQ